MKVSFMSWLYPHLDLDGLIAKAKRFGYQGIEFRTEVQHGHGVETVMSAAEIETVKTKMKNAGLDACCLAPGVKFVSPDKNERDAELQKLYAYIKLAASLGVPCIRFFADTIPNKGRGTREESYRIQAEYMRQAADAAGEAGVRLCLETHGNFRAYDAGELLYRTAYPAALWINWHLAHCINHGEDVDEAYRHVKGRVCHAHFSMSEHVERQMELLHADGFQGHFSLEIMEKDEAKSDTIVAAQIASWTAVRDQLRRSSCE
ncbi:MAG: sugar phosphate isomerase/epimerase [Spirochaetes bacterium]|nr:sugar phosphate isomerase/epimerase [Spirochaetota bacterium]